MHRIKNLISHQHIGQAALVSLAFSFFFALALPLQTFLGNTEMFDYSIWELLQELLVVWLLMFLVSFFVQLVTEPFWGRFVHLGFLICAVFAYLESGILSIGLPQLNGELWLFCRPSIRQYLDLWLFGAGSIVALVFRKAIYSCLHWVSLSLLVMSVAFIFDVERHNPKSRPKTEFDEGFCPVYDMVKSAELSANRNVIVVIVDMTPADIVDQVMSEHPELRKHFKGFTAFPENIGMHDNTTKGMPALVTGKYLERETSYADNIASFWGADSVLSAYKYAGYDMYVRMYVSDSYTNRRKFFSPKGEPPSSSLAFLRYTKGEPYLTLKDIVMFKLMLYRRKHWIIANAIRAGRAKAFKNLKNLTREWEAYPLFDALPISTNSHSRTFCLFHTEGVHIPVPKDGKGNDLPQPSESREAIKEYLPYVMSHVAGFMDSLVDKNVYDNSMIIIAADHGILYDAKSAMLWVKPFGANGEYSVKHAPTSHSQIAALLNESVERNLTEREVVDILSMKCRKLRVRQPSHDKWWQFGRVVDTYDILYDENGKELSRENLGEFKVN